jgi:hypothetical protein
MDQENKFYRIRSGYSHAILGDIGGWEVVVTRSFRGEGTLYFDTELTEKTISSLSEDRKSGFFSKNYIFTRIRIAQSDTSPSDLSEESKERQKAIRQIQLQWYDQVGKQEADPTEVEGETESDGQYDDGRRQAMRALAVIGFILLTTFIKSQCEDDQNSGSGGSWRRSTGGHYM